MNILLQPSYFPSISTFIALIKAEKVCLEIQDNFQKQTNRNRMYIYSPNGKQLLNVPVKHSKESKIKTKDIKIENDFGWQKQHFKSLEAAYRSSPYFEYFEAMMRPIFEKKYTFLKDVQEDSFAFVNKCLGINLVAELTTAYELNPTETSDFRYLVDGKKDTTIVNPYKQVFDEKHGFLNNLSILDLLFNEGRFGLSYLKTQELIF